MVHGRFVVKGEMGGGLTPRLTNDLPRRPSPFPPLSPGSRRHSAACKNMGLTLEVPPALLAEWWWWHFVEARKAK